MITFLSYHHGKIPPLTSTNSPTASEQKLDHEMDGFAPSHVPVLLQNEVMYIWLDLPHNKHARHGSIAY
jgi:hypothetical protein